MNFKVHMQDALVLFSDFDEDHSRFGAETSEHQFITPEEIEDDSKRDEYLKRYQGLIFSTENLFVESKFEVTDDLQFF